MVHNERSIFQLPCLYSSKHPAFSIEIIFISLIFRHKAQRRPTPLLHSHPHSLTHTRKSNYFSFKSHPSHSRYSPTLITRIKGKIEQIFHFNFNNGHDNESDRSCVPQSAVPVCLLFDCFNDSPSIIPCNNQRDTKGNQLNILIQFTHLCRMRQRRKYDCIVESEEARNGKMETKKKKKKKEQWQQKWNEKNGWVEKTVENQQNARE